MSTILDLPSRISVVDDEDDVVKALERRLKRRGFDVARVIPPTPTLEDTLNEIMRVSDAALCDHHLQGGHKVEFSGAQLVARLTERRFPAVLFTGVLPDQRYGIRREMSHIPSFLTREADGGLGNQRVLEALTESVAEVRDGRTSARRRGRRTLVSVVNSRLSGNEHLVEVVVSGWARRESMEIPADLLATPWAGSPHKAVGLTFFASVNVAEMESDHLFFADFESEPAETTRPLFPLPE